MLRMKGLRQYIPWWARIGSKIILTRLPIPYAFWKRLRLFEHGNMNLPHFALNTFVEHACSAGVLDAGSPLAHLKSSSPDSPEFNVLELGPGDSLFTAVIVKCFGGTRTWLVDAGPFATTDISVYLGLIYFLQQKGFSLPFDAAQKTLSDILEKCNGQYLTGGVDSLRQIPNESVDYCFSNAVLEHVPKGQFSELADELCRILKPDGVCFHRVDLKDHLGGGLNNLRFSDAIWETPIFRNSGFYTNRIRFGEIIRIFEDAGFECRCTRVIRWKSIPTPINKIHTIFQGAPFDELLVSGFDVLLKRKG